MRAGAWYDDNDIYVRLDKVQTSTMGSTSYLNSSTGVTVQIWSSGTTSSTGNLVVAATNMPYVSGSNGRYQVTVQSTDHSMAVGTVGMARIHLSHSGANGEWRPKFRVETRRST